jgi:hypothetical protein
MPTVTCSHCGERHRVKADCAGKQLRCPSCEKRFVVPGDDEDEDIEQPSERRIRRERADVQRSASSPGRDGRARRRPEPEEEEEEQPTGSGSKLGLILALVGGGAFLFIGALAVGGYLVYSRMSAKANNLVQAASQNAAMANNAMAKMDAPGPDAKAPDNQGNPPAPGAPAPGGQQGAAPPAPAPASDPATRQAQQMLVGTWLCNFLGGRIITYEFRNDGTVLITAGNDRKTGTYRLVSATAVDCRVDGTDYSYDMKLAQNDLVLAQKTKSGMTFPLNFKRAGTPGAPDPAAAGSQSGTGKQPSTGRPPRRPRR